jgi:TetR/AcrR family transcriptional regulator, lmrAB and yxaGH operons repressor
MTIIIINYDNYHSQAEFMKQDSREQMIEGALSLLAQQGLQATSFSEVLKLTKAPRGSIYHHFPGGKDELVSEALKLLEKRTIKSIQALDSADPEKIVEGFLGLWRYLLTTYNFSTGCSAVAVTVATNSPELLKQSESIFESWQKVLSKKFINAGITPKQSAEFATTLIAASEGAVVMARSAKSMEPFERVSTQLLAQSKQLTRV